MINKKILIFVPHPDDEINVAGAFIYDRVREHYQVYVAFLTSGDRGGSVKGEARIKEAITSLKILGVDAEKVIFLGYGNGWKGDIHIYNADENEVIMSQAGVTETYGTDEYQDYAYRTYGYHHTYTRAHMKLDIRSVILSILPGTIVCVDFDSHPDHRALSLLFEECMGEILKERRQYTPLVLKKFAYAGVYHGESDYYSMPMQETKCPNRETVLDGRYELDVPSYRWKDRIQFSVGRETVTRHLSSNILYKAAKQHSSQKFSTKIHQIANADIVYWQRRTDSLSYSAEVSASSGDVQYVNDFKLIDSRNICQQDIGSRMFDHYLWVPEEDDPQKTLSFRFCEPVNIAMVRFYENFSPRDNIVKGILQFDNGYSLIVDNIEHSGKSTDLQFEKQIGIHRLEFKILEYEGCNFGIAEFEIYENAIQAIPFERYEKTGSQSRSIEEAIDIKLDKWLIGYQDKEIKNQKYYRMFKLALAWGELERGSVGSYLKRKGYQRIGIYGLKELGMHLCKELEYTDISVLIGIDRNPVISWASFKVYNTLEQICCEELDAIIVTPFIEYDAIKKELEARGVHGNKIISLEQVIYEA